MQSTYRIQTRARTHVPGDRPDTRPWRNYPSRRIRRDTFPRCTTAISREAPRTSGFETISRSSPTEARQFRCRNERPRKEPLHEAATDFSSGRITTSSYNARMSTRRARTFALALLAICPATAGTGRVRRAGRSRSPEKFPTRQPGNLYLQINQTTFNLYNIL